MLAMPLIQFLCPEAKGSFIPAEAEDKVGFIVGMRGPPTDTATLTSYDGGITGREGEAMEFYNSQVNLLQPFSPVTGLERTTG